MDLLNLFTENVKSENKHDTKELLKHQMIIVPIHSTIQAHWSVAVLYVSDRKVNLFITTVLATRAIILGKLSNVIFLKNLASKISRTGKIFPLLVPTIKRMDFLAEFIYVVKCLLEGIFSWNKSFEVIQADLDSFRASLLGLLVDKGDPFFL